MNLRTLTLAACVTVIATVAVAHKGATGVLLERMQGMMAMGKATKEIAPMMRGQQDYEAARASEYAAVLRTHSGDAMLALFPEGLNAAPSVAKDEIWTNWAEFEEMANELALYAQALDQAAANGLGDAAPAAASMMGDETSTMMGGDASGMMGGTAEAPMTLDMLSAMPVNVLFAQTAQSCSACHSKFRTEE
jgi:cytochrome c556